MIQIEHIQSPFYHIELKNIFSELELNDLIREISFLQDKLKFAEDTGSSVASEEVLKKNKGIFLSEIEKNYDTNIFLKKINSVLENVGKKSKWKNLCFKRLFSSLSWQGDLIQKYQNGDYYKPHIDSGVFTFIMWIYEGEKKSSEGDLYFPEYNYLHPCKNNNGIIFFSKELHGVTTLRSNSDFIRYSITTFSTSDDGFKTKEETIEIKNKMKRMRKINSLKNNLIYN